MSIAIEDTQTPSQASASEQLRTSMAAVRVSFTWLGVRKSLNTTQKDQAAHSFGAQGKFLSAGKKLLDTSHPAFKAVSSVRSRTISYWKSVSLPFPEPGIRLIRQEAVTNFSSKIQEFSSQLVAAVTELSSQYADLRSAAQERLGGLFDPRDYPESLDGQFGIEHDFPSVEPPSYLAQLAPAVYQQECRRMQTRFEEAVQLAEQAFMTELSRLVEHLAERLSSESDGTPKIFRDSAVTNLTEFFERFRRLSIRSNQELDELVGRAQQIMRGVNPQRLRDRPRLQQQIAEQISQVQNRLDSMLIDRPRRNILRRAR